MGYSHDQLRAAWQQHEPTIRAEAARRGIAIWFLSRDWFVRSIDGESLPAPDEPDDDGDE